MASIEVLEKEWLHRISLVKQGGQPERTFQRSNLFYNYLFECNKQGITPCTFSTFKYNYIYKLEDKYGYTKEDINIFSKADAKLYHRFGTEFIEYNLDLLECIGILATEKSGIAEPLQEPLSKRGIYVIDTQGIQSRYAMQIMQRYATVKRPTFTMSDYDVSGCFMMKRYQAIGAHRVTLLDVIKELNLNEDDLIQEDTSKRNNHWGSIDDVDKDWLRPDWRKGKTYTRKIELDVVMSHVKTNDFCDAVLNLIDKYILLKDVGSVMVMPDLPSEVKTLLSDLRMALSMLGKYTEKRDIIKDDFSDITEHIKDIDLTNYEDEAQDELDVIDSTSEIKELKLLIDKLQ